jgi:hypothetical protein
MLQLELLAYSRIPFLSIVMLRIMGHQANHAVSYNHFDSLHTTWAPKILSFSKSIESFKSVYAKYRIKSAAS